MKALFQKIDAGYAAERAGRPGAEICRGWLDAWNDVKRLSAGAGVASIEDFDELFEGSEPIYNWIQDLEAKLWTGGLEDPDLFRSRIAFCQEALERLNLDDSLTRENMHRAIAESHFQLGETERTEALYLKWLGDDPQWGWGWIGWADCYWLMRLGPGDPERCESLLRQGLAIEGVRDRREIADRLADLLLDHGREPEAIEVRQEAERREARQLASASFETRLEGGARKQTIRFSGPGTPLDKLSAVMAAMRGALLSTPAQQPKAGRNDPCPCGSGKKFKKCCGG
jgi:tetratricopeptide (TPR) repeat protein